MADLHIGFGTPWQAQIDFLLAKLRPENEELSLCFDPTAQAIGEFTDGDPGKATLHKEDLVFDNIKLVTRSYK